MTGRDGQLAGWGMIRPCRKGHKIGPLVADDRASAEVVLSALLASVGGGEIFLDVPESVRRIRRNCSLMATRFRSQSVIPSRIKRWGEEQCVGHYWQ
jgi:hypothetical protein